jgi:hypothetical protein
MDRPEPLSIPATGQPSRPSPARAATLAAYQFKQSRASSQPAGERLPVFGSSPGSGRDSPLSSGNGGAYGVIGGSRTPSRFSSGLPAPGPATRANSFSVAEGGLSHRVGPVYFERIMYLQVMLLTIRTRLARREHSLLTQKKDYLDHIPNRLTLPFHQLHLYLASTPNNLLARHLAPKPTFHDHDHSH